MCLKLCLRYIMYNINICILHRNSDFIPNYVDVIKRFINPVKKIINKIGNIFFVQD